MQTVRGWGFRGCRGHTQHLGEMQGDAQGAAPAARGRIGAAQQARGAHGGVPGPQLPPPPQKKVPVGPRRCPRDPTPAPLPPPPVPAGPAQRRREHGGGGGPGREGGVGP